MTTNLPPATDHRDHQAFSTDALLTLREIADLTGRDHTTIKKWRSYGRWPGAVQDETGRQAWRVPVTDLVASGDLAPAQVGQVDNELAARRESRETRALREQVARLEERLDAARAIADERATQIRFLQGMLRKGGGM